MKQSIIQITTSAYHEMLRNVGSITAEAGGLLFGTTDDYVVQKFIYDKDAVTTRTTYSFNAPFLNSKIDELRREGLEPVGFFHSHPPFAQQLSNPDKMYFKSQFKNFPNHDRFIVPLMFPAVDGQYDFIPYLIYKNGRVEKATLELLPDNYQIYIERPPELLPPIPTGVAETLPLHTLFRTYYLVLWSAFLTGLLISIFSLMRFFYLYLKHTLTL